MFYIGSWPDIKESAVYWQQITSQYSDMHVLTHEPNEIICICKPTGHPDT
jgi:hypothetical protein